MIAAVNKRWGGGGWKSFSQPSRITSLIVQERELATRSCTGVMHSRKILEAVCSISWLTLACIICSSSIDKGNTDSKGYIICILLK